MMRLKLKQIRLSKYMSSHNQLLLSKSNSRLSQTAHIRQSNSLRKSIKETPELVKTLFKLFVRRKRFSFQLLKYFVIFPGSSQISEDFSIDSYDRLIFGDEAIHSMVKIYEVKEIENIIWAFINLKALKYLKSCEIFTEKVNKYYRMHAPHQQHFAFHQLKQYNIHILNEGSRKCKKSVNCSIETESRQRLVSKSKIIDLKISPQTQQLKPESASLKSGINSESHVIPEGSLLKSQYSMKSGRVLAENTRNRTPSTTKVHFTYTSPPKQQLQSAKTSQQRNNRKTSQLGEQYRFRVPKKFANQQKNFCGKCCGFCQGPE